MSYSTDIKDCIKRWTSYSTSHGIIYISRADNKFYRLIWTLCFCVCIGYCIYLSTHTISNFINHEVYVNMKVVHDASVEFPAVTLCFLKSFNKTRVEDFITTIFPNITLDDLTNISNENDTELILKLYSVRTKIHNSNDSLKRSLGFELKNIMFYCTFSAKQCNSNDFKWFYHYWFGNCYTFNSGFDSNENKIEVLKTTTPGYIYGLVIELFMDNSEGSSALDSIDGVYLLVHNKSINPYSLVAREGVTVPFGECTNIGIKRQFIKKLSYPYSDCIENTNETNIKLSDSYNYLIKETGYVYSESLCIEICIQQQTIKSCNCTNPSLLGIKNIPVCEDIKDILCVQDITKNILLGDLGKKCAKDCPIACETIDYSLTLSTSSYPTENYAKYLAKQQFHKSIGINEYNINKNVLKMFVFYENFKYTYVKEAPVLNLDTFFANIGGTLGLTLGMSFLSLIEIIFVAVEICLIVMKKLFKRQINGNVKPNVIQVKPYTSQ